MTTYSRFHHGMIGILGGALRVSTLGCSTPLHTREKGALIGGGTGVGVGALIGGWPGAAIGGTVGAGGGALVGDQMEKQDRDEDR